MKILAVTNLYPPYILGGYEILCQHVVDELRGRGHKMVVLTSNHGVENDPLYQDRPDIRRRLKLYVPFGQTAQLLRHRRWLIGKYNYQLTREVIAREKPDMIFIWSQLRLTLGPCRAAENSGVPVAYSLNDEHLAGFVPSQLNFSLQGMARYAADHWVLPGITLQGLKLQNVTCISQVLKDNLVAKGVPIPHAKVIYQGVPLELFPQKQEDGQANAKPYVRLLYAGQLLNYKGVHTLLDAVGMMQSFIDMRKRRKLFRVTLVGDGPDSYKQELMKIAEKRKVSLSLLEKQPHDELSQFYQKSDIFVFPSIWQEPFGLTHLEAMSSGTPVISTAEGGQKEFLRDGENALIFEKGRAGQLAHRILKLIDNPGLKSYIVAKARQTVERFFTVRRYVSDIEKFLYDSTERSRQNL